MVLRRYLISKERLIPGEGGDCHKDRDPGWEVVCLSLGDKDLSWGLYIDRHLCWTDRGPTSGSETEVEKFRGMSTGTRTWTGQMGACSQRETSAGHLKGLSSLCLMPSNQAKAQGRAGPPRG